MAETLFKEITYSLSKLIEDIRVGQIGLPELQRPFVWPNVKVRDLLDSMYRGYPVGNLLFWENAGAADHTLIGRHDGKRKKFPHLLVIDGQQRLTALYAVMCGAPVVREGYQFERIRIAFRPISDEFSVADATTDRDPTWIPDISVIWSDDGDLFELAHSYVARLRGGPGDEKKKAQSAIQRLSNLKTYPFTALELSASISEEQVSDVFVRINSKGTPLNQSDFILTLMSVFADEERTRLEEFCRDARKPPRGKPSAFNYLIQPDPDHLLRVAVGVAFRRAKLHYVYAILRGKDLQTGEISEERRLEQFGRLAKAQEHVLNLQYFHDFLLCLQEAGYSSGDHIMSLHALLFSYALFLIGRLDFRVKDDELRNVIARWFFFCVLTSRYTKSSESIFEADLAELRTVADAQGFVHYLEQQMRQVLTNDYWQITLPSALATSSARTPPLYAYYAALVLLDATVLFSNLKLHTLLNPAIKSKKSALERHHLFPKAHLKGVGIESLRDVNQIANYALVEWAKNVAISDRAPREYFPEMVAKSAAKVQWDQVSFWHALPEGWCEMSYFDFLAERRRAIAAVIRAGFESLEPARGRHFVPSTTPLTAAAPEAIWHRFLSLVPEEAWPIVTKYVGEPLRTSDDLQRELDEYMKELRNRSCDEILNLEAAEAAYEGCSRLMRVHASSTDDARRVIQAAVLYFAEAEDAVPDILNREGFADDLAVVRAAASILRGD
ncbi:MAG: DUF262 domain-containing protein [Candidatus Schekmanbacteria bacterium]|nr:DUF262 domain-containing protein [Candidatus Schekmanbacteria bacterium]